MEVESNYINALDAVTTGTLDGLKLALNVGAMLIAFLGLLAFINGLLGWTGGQLGLPQLSLEWILSYLMFPFAWLMGIPLADCSQVGIILGKKIILNEFVAYLDLQKMIPTLSERTTIIVTYALCGFSNLGSIGIQIGGLSAIAPNRQQDLALLGLRAMIAGSLACFTTACVTGMLL